MGYAMCRSNGLCQVLQQGVMPAAAALDYARYCLLQLCHSYVLLARAELKVIHVERGTQMPDRMAAAFCQVQVIFCYDAQGVSIASAHHDYMMAVIFDV
jgi:hypothetical protein